MKGEGSGSVLSPEARVGGDVTHVLIEPDTLQVLLRDAYITGCGDVHANYQDDDEPDFTEASYDYVASLDFTETTQPGNRCGPEQYAGGFTAGLLQAVQTLRIYAGQHTAAAVACKRIAEEHGNLTAAAILRSYANGLEMDAERFASGASPASPIPPLMTPQPSKHEQSQ